MLDFLMRRGEFIFPPKLPGYSRVRADVCRAPGGGVSTRRSRKDPRDPQHTPPKRDFARTPRRESPRDVVVSGCQPARPWLITGNPPNAVYADVQTTAQTETTQTPAAHLRLARSESDSQVRGSRASCSQSPHPFTNSRGSKTVSYPPHTHGGTHRCVPASGNGRISALA